MSKFTAAHRETTLLKFKGVAVNTGLRILATIFLIILAVCSKFTQADIRRVGHGPARDLAKGGEGVQPSADVIDGVSAMAQKRENAIVSDMQIEAKRAIRNTVKLSPKQAKVDRDIAIAEADGGLSSSLESCGMQSANAQTTCEHNARALHDRSIGTAKINWTFASAKLSVP